MIRMVVNSTATAVTKREEGADLSTRGEGIEPRDLVAGAWGKNH